MLRLDDLHVRCTDANNVTTLVVIGTIFGGG